MNPVERRIGVLMPVYNGSVHLREAIDSILNQTYQNFDFFIINDGSTDDSEQIIRTYTDDRIFYLKNEKNMGLVLSLNKGLEVIHNEFIVRMDADDISLPERFSRQIEFMDTHTELAASGTMIKYFGSENGISDFPLTHNKLRAKLIFAHGIIHPTAILRSAFIRKHDLRYNPDYFFIEDYEFWIRLTELGRIANLPEVLLHYRWDGQNVTAKNWHRRSERYKLIYSGILKKLNIEPTEKNLQLHLELAFNSQKIGSVRQLRSHHNMLLVMNAKLNVFPEKEFQEQLLLYWQKLFYRCADNGLLEAFRYWILSSYFRLNHLKYLLGRIFRNVH